MAPSEHDGVMRLAGGDSRLWVRFEKKAVKMAFKSELEGRPIYEEVVYVRIQQPGERDVFVQPAREEHKLRFPRQWAAFQAGTEQLPEGTPIGLLFPNQESVREVMLDLKIYNIEQLANLSENAIERLGMDGRKYVARAKAFLEKADAFKEVTQLTQKVETLESQLQVERDTKARLVERIEQQDDRIHQLEDRLLERDIQPPATATQPRRSTGRAPKMWDEPPQRAQPAPERPEVVG